MKKTLLVYGLLMAALVGLLKYLDYHFLIRDLSWELYVGIISLVFTLLGVWVGLKLTRSPQKIATEPSSQRFTPDPHVLSNSGISNREYEVLELMAQGLSNQEIADQLFISLNTVKTHSSNLYQKLDVKRRTQAIQQAKNLGLLP